MIRIDSREDGATIVAFKNACHKIKIDTLESGDIVQGEYAIEHKKPADFWQSLNDGRLFSQIEKMSLNFKAFAIVVSGNPEDILYNNVGIGAISSCIVRGAPIIFCKNLSTTVKVSLALLEKWNDGKNRNFNPSINKKLTKDAQLNIITGIPNISEVVGNTLLNHFGSIRDICNASIDELKAVHGVGDVIAVKIFNSLNSPRW